jgi:predicted P-loop ATPase
MDRDEMRTALALLIPPGQVTELRAFGVCVDGHWRKGGRVVSGYFNDMDALARAAMTLRRGEGATTAGIYFIPNPIARGALLKSKNRLAEKTLTATSDDHITRRTRLLIDIDPVCSVDGMAIKGIPASDEEARAAAMLANTIECELRSEGWPEGVVASSGNGAHLIYALDMPNDDAALAMVKQIFDALHRRYSTDLVQVDQTTCNAARIWKLYGSCSGRGDEDEEMTRVYRTARIVSAPLSLEAVPLSCLQVLAVESMAAEAVERQAEEEKREASRPKAQESSRSSSRSGVRGDFDVSGFVRSHLRVQREKAWKGGGSVWVLAESPMCAHGGDGPFVAVHSDGAIAAGCHHDSCAWGWRDLREHCDPDARERREAWEARQQAPRLSIVREPEVVAPAKEKPPEETNTEARAWSHLKMGKHAPKNTRSNACEVLTRDARIDGVFAWDEMSGAVVVRKAPPWSGTHYEPTAWSVERPLTDGDLTHVSAWIDREYDFEPSIDSAARAVHAAATRHSYHAVCEWLDTLDDTEETAALDTWLIEHLGAEDTPYVRAVGRWWLISAVARAYKPGVKADHVLVLEGAQGLGKSSALRALCPRRSWLLDSELDLQHAAKDAYQAIKGRWIVELAELDGLSRKSEASALKRFLTSNTDSYRPAYARFGVDVPRTCVFAGTVNESEYLRDPTGNRRFWPVRCESIDLAGLGRARDELWAQARSAYSRGEQWHPSARMIDQIKSEQSDREERDVWERPVLVWLTEGARLRATASEILTGACDLSVGQQTTHHQRRVSAIMDRLGWTKARRRVGGRQVRCFEAPADALPGVPDESADWF